MADLRSRFIEDYAGGLLNVSRQELASTGEVLSQDGFLSDASSFVEDGTGSKSGLKLGLSLCEVVDPTTEQGAVNVRYADRTYASIRDLKIFSTAIASAQAALADATSSSITNLETAFELLEDSQDSLQNQIDTNNTLFDEKIASITSSISQANLATNAEPGIIEIATPGEVASFNDTTRAVVPSTLGSVRGVADGFASLDGDGLLPVTELPQIPAEKIPVLPLSNIPVLDDSKIPLLEVSKIPVLPANKLLTAPVPWVATAANFELSANFTFAHSGTGTELLLGAANTTNDVVGTSGFIYVTNSTGVSLLSIDSTDWKPTIGTWVDPETGEDGLSGNLLIGYYIANVGVVIYTATRVGT